MQLKQSNLIEMEMKDGKWFLFTNISLPCHLILAVLYMNSVNNKDTILNKDDNTSEGRNELFDIVWSNEYDYEEDDKDSGSKQVKTNQVGRKGGQYGNG